MQFADQSICYPGPTVCENWLWAFPPPPIWQFAIRDPGLPPIYYNETDQNPQGKFTTIEDHSVALRAFDDDGNFCDREKTVTSRWPLPEWREISPF